MVKSAIAALLVMVALAGPAAGGEVMLLDFASPTCGPCQQMIPTVQSLEQAGYPVRRVDVTRETDLARQFQVDRVPCFIALADGREVTRIVGSTSREQLEQMLQQAQRVAGAQVRAQSPDTLAGGTLAGGQPGLSNAPQQSPWTGVSGASARGPADAAQPSSGIEPSRDAYSANLICSSVRLRVDDPAGHSYGTGTIIDARSGEALVITVGHLFRDSKGKGPVMVELFVATPEGVRVVDQVPGQIVSYNLDRDIGLVSIRPRQPVRVAPIAPTQTIIDRGERVTSVGCDHGKDPTALASRVTYVNRYQGPPNFEVSGAPVEGRSGGGLFNSAGQLVGVCFAADYEGNEGLYTALESIHDELDRVGLSAIYQSPGQTPVANALAAQATGPVVRGQEPTQPMVAADRTPVTPVGLTIPVGPQGAAASVPYNLSSSEQAALEEIMSRATTSEVVCIIRPKDPGAKSEVITLDNVSPEFVRALASRTKPGSTGGLR